MNKDGAMTYDHAKSAIETSTGRFVDLYDPKPETIDIRDIVAGMARQTRYAGQLQLGVWHYSIAEHALMVDDLMQHLRYGNLHREAALFHDAPEAFLQDLTAPLKFALRLEEREAVVDAVEGRRAVQRLEDGYSSSYDLLTGRMEWAIAERFGCARALWNSTTLRTADMWALRIESRVLIHSGGAHWRWPGQLPNDGKAPDGIRVRQLHPQDAYEHLLARFYEVLGVDRIEA